jgi:hypothetical protein
VLRCPLDGAAGAGGGGGGGIGGGGGGIIGQRSTGKNWALALAQPPLHDGGGGGGGGYGGGCGGRRLSVNVATVMSRGRDDDDDGGEGHTDDGNLFGGRAMSPLMGAGSLPPPSPVTHLSEGSELWPHSMDRTTRHLLSRDVRRDIFSGASVGGAGRLGTFLYSPHYFAVKTHIQLMTAGIVHVTNRVSPGSASLPTLLSGRLTLDVHSRAVAAEAAAMAGSLVAAGQVGLYKLQPVLYTDLRSYLVQRIQLTHSLKTLWFQALNLSSENLVSKFAFQMGQLVPLHPGSPRHDARRGRKSATPTPYRRPRQLLRIPRPRRARWRLLYQRRARRRRRGGAPRVGLQPPRRAGRARAGSGLDGR